MVPGPVYNNIDTAYALRNVKRKIFLPDKSYDAQTLIKSTEYLIGHNLSKYSQEIILGLDKIRHFIKTGTIARNKLSQTIRHYLDHPPSTQPENKPPPPQQKELHIPRPNTVIKESQKRPVPYQSVAVLYSTIDPCPKTDFLEN